MNTEGREFWKRAVTAIKSAHILQFVDPDGSASRAYYAAFYAASALFTLRGQTFTSHKAIRSAVHRDLVKPGLWAKSLGADYDELLERRQIGDYGSFLHVSAQDATDAISAAERIMKAVHQIYPDNFPFEDVLE